MADNNKKSNFSSLSQGEGRGEALITGAEALMRSLEHQGVKTLFGYPGGQHHAGIRCLIRPSDRN